MNPAHQLIDQIIEDLKKSMIDTNIQPFFTKFLDSLAGSEVLMQKLIKAHDQQITSAIARHINQNPDLNIDEP